MSKAQRLKGHNFEREIVRRFKEHLPSRRILEYQKENALGVDVIAGPFAIQCKRLKKSVPMSCLYEIQEHEDYFRLLISKVDREEELVTLRLEDFIKLTFYMSFWNKRKQGRTDELRAELEGSSKNRETSQRHD